MSIAILQSKNVAHGSGGSSATASGAGYASNTTPGSLLVLVAWAIGSSANIGTAPSIGTPTTSGFTWTQANLANFSDSSGPNGGRVNIYYIQNAGAMSSATSTSVTATKTGTSPACTVEFACYEFSGVKISGALDASAGQNSQTSSPVNPGSLSTNGTALIFATGIGEASFSTGSGFTTGISSTAANFGRSQYILNQAAGSISTAFGSSTGFWGACAVDFLSATPPAPTFSSISPNAGALAGGTVTTLTGTGLTGATGVTFGGNAATSVTVLSDSSVSCITPSHAAGAVNVVITTPGGTATLTNGYLYEAAPAPTSVTPNAGALAGGTAITISGTGFITGCTATLGGAAVTSLVFVNSTTLTGVTPAGSAGAATLVVTNPDTQTGSLGSAYTFEAAPNPTSVSPNAGALAGGTAVTITGTGFLTGATVKFGSSSATSVVVVNSTTITCVTPSGSGAENVTVTNTDTQVGTLTNGYTFQAAPTVASVTPNAGSLTGFTAVTISGTGFLSGATATFGGSAATNVVVVSDISITCNTPSHAGGAVNVVVQNTDTQTGTLVSGYLYEAAPTVSSCSPNNGTISGGTAVTVTGTGFITGATILFGGTSATSVVFTNSTTLTCVTPAHAAGLVSVAVTNPDGQIGSANAFTYNTVVLPAPTVSSVSPASGTTLGGTPVNISGNNFVSGALVSFGGVPATNIVVLSAIAIFCVTSPSTAGPVTVTVQNVDAQVAMLVNGFTYIAPPAILSVTPSSGSVNGGTSVTITGSSFQNGAQVLFGSTPATSVTVVNSSTITAVSPAGVGTVNVTVINPDGQQATQASSYSYVQYFRSSGFAKLPNGQAFSGAQITVTNQSTGLPATLFADAAGAVPIVGSITADNYGGYAFYSTPMFFTLTISNGSTTLNFPDQYIGTGLTPNLFGKDVWIVDALGKAVCGAQLYVLQQPANTVVTSATQLGPLATVYSDSLGLNGPVTQPVIADQYGHTFFYVVPSLYTLVYVVGGKVQNTFKDQKCQ